MKNTIKIVTDSACDITKEEENEYGIEILSFPITADGNSYMERVDLTNREFYDLLDTCASIPTTAQITHIRFEELYERVYADGYTDLIYVAINSTGSNTYNNSIMAKNIFYENHPEAKDKFRIYPVDSKTYTIAYGYPVMQAALKAQKGMSAADIVAYLEDWFASVEIYFAPYTLDYVKKSGRVSCAAAFVGELLGLRPIISIIDGETAIVEKVRGDKSIIPALIKHAGKSKIPQTDYCLIGGSLEDKYDELKKEVVSAFKYEPVNAAYAGAAISINAGPKVVGIIVKGQKRER
ncbi:MAG: DegV family protein [Clostridiales bacterium]|nr:DegV family protein [Clostridiales bacterium]